MYFGVTKTFDKKNQILGQESYISWKKEILGLNF